MSMMRRYADLSQGQLHYRETGQGSPLVLFHQTASSSSMYERSAPLLAKRFRVIAPDTPNFGLSDPLPQKPSMADYARVMVELLDHLGIQQAAVAGFHTGAHIAIEAAATYPDRISRAVMVGVLPVADDAERAEWHKQIVKPWKPDFEGEFLKPNLALLQSYMDPSDGEALWEELTQRLLAGPNYWHAYEAVLNHDAIGQAKRIAVPSLYINPQADMLIPQTKFMHSITPGAEYAEIPGGADAIMMQPQAFADELIRFCG